MAGLFQLTDSIVDELGGDAALAKGVIDELSKGVEYDLYKAREEQQETARINRIEHGSTEMGRLRMRVPETAYHYWGQRLGYQCWKDKRFLAEYERDNASAKVAYRRKMMVGVDGFKPSPSAEPVAVTDRRAAGLTDEEKSARWKSTNRKGGA